MEKTEYWVDGPLIGPKLTQAEELEFVDLNMIVNNLSEQQGMSLVTDDILDGNIMFRYRKLQIRKYYYNNRGTYE